jgi:hypothetical protein
MDAMENVLVLGTGEGDDALASVKVARLLLQQLLHELVEPANRPSAVLVSHPLGPRAKTWMSATPSGPNPCGPPPLPPPHVSSHELAAHVPDAVQSENA